MITEDSIKALRIFFMLTLTRALFPTGTGKSLMNPAFPLMMKMIVLLRSNTEVCNHK